MVGSVAFQKASRCPITCARGEEALIVISSAVFDHCDRPRNAPVVRPHIPGRPMENRARVACPLCDERVLVPWRVLLDGAGLSAGVRF